MANLSQFDTRKKSHEGVDIPLVIEGETVYGEDGEPVTFRVKGLADPEVHALILQGRTSGAKRTPDEVVQADLKLARAAVVGWSDNWTIEDEEGNEVKLPFSRANVGRVFLVPEIRRAILGEVADSGHFMNRASSKPSSTSDNSPG